MNWIVLYQKDGRLCEALFESELDAEVFADVAGWPARVRLVVHAAEKPSPSAGSAEPGEKAP